MADTLTSNIKLTNQTEGGNNNSWGSLADANFEKIDDKFGDVTSISTTGGTTTLSDTQETVNAIRVSGALVSNATIVFSGRGGSWIVENETTGSFTVTVKVSGQTGVAIEQGGAALVYCNGTDIDFGNPPSSATAEVTVASATTCDILGAASEYIAISGTTTITSLGTGTNKKRFVRATGAFKLTHHSTTLICPGGKDITTAAGDTFTVVSDASSNARVVDYQRAAVPPNMFPPGAIVDYAGTSAPAGWILCYGQNISRTTYAALFDAIGVTYGVGDGTTTFTLPDCNGRVRAGKDNMGGSAAGRLTTAGSVVDGATLGAVGGAQSVTLLESQIPNHSHTASVTDPGHAHTYTTWSTNTFAGGAFSAAQASSTTNTGSATTGISVSISATGGSGGHTNVQPTIIFNTIIFAGV